MYRQPSEHAYSRPSQHQGAMIHDEHSHIAQTFYAAHPHQAAQAAHPLHPSDLDPSYYQPAPPPKQQAIYGPPLSQQQHSQQMSSQRPIRSRPIPPSHFKDDPAFSPDPRTNPLAYTTFAMNSREEIVPTAGNQEYSSLPNPYDTAPKRDPSAIYAYPPAPSVPQTPAASQYYAPSIHLYPSAGSEHSRPPSEVDSFYAFAASFPSPNGSYHMDPRASADASSVHLAYDDGEERVAPPEPSPTTRQSYYSKYVEAQDPYPEEHSSGKPRKARHADKDRKHASQTSLASGANTSHSSHKSSSASSFARAQSGDVSIKSSKSRSSLRVANPDPYAIFMPQHSPETSASSITSSSEGPHTPPSAHGHFDPNASFAGSLGEKGYADDKSLRGKKSKEAAMAREEHAHAHRQEHEAPPAYTPLPTPTETVASAGPSRSHDSKIEYAPGPVQVTLTPDGITLDPIQPSTSQASASSSSSRRAKREAARGAERPPMPQGNVSAPELHVPPLRDSPERPATAPLAAPPPAAAPTVSSMANPSSATPSAPPMVRSRSRKPSIATPPKDLDKIDELDESDPLGVAWHMPGPYDVIPKVAKIAHAEFEGGEGGKPKIFAAQAGQAAPGGGDGSMNGRRKPIAVDPNTTSFAVKPGQIFPPIALPTHLPPPHATPMTPQAPFSPTMRQAYVNNHMVPGAARPEPPPPVFSPTPSEMARQHSERDLRRKRRQREKEEMAMNGPNLSGVGTAYASTLSEGHSMSGSSGFASSASGHGSTHRSGGQAQAVPVPMQMQREQHMHQHQQHQHNIPHRPYPNPVQPQSGVPPEQQLKPQSSRSTLSRSRSTPNSAPSNGSSQPYPQQGLSNEPPPTPDIQLPPPPAPQSANPIPPPPASMHGGGAPSMHSSMTGRSQMPPSNRYVPRQLVMPTPLQPMQPLPGQAPAPPPPAPAAQQTAPRGAPVGYAGSGSASGAPLKHRQTVPVRGAKPQAQEIPMSQGKNVLRKHKENGRENNARENGREPERVVRSRSSRADVSTGSGASSLGRESRRAAAAAAAAAEGGATAVWEGRVVVVPEEKKKSGGGLGSLFSFSTSTSREKEREREREKEKERALAERAREKEREREREREGQKKKLSKAKR